MFIGIDPGDRNLAIGMISGARLVGTHHLNPRNFGFSGMLKHILSVIDDCDDEVSGVAIERFVAYKGVLTPSSETILMVIGGLHSVLSARGIPDDKILLMRAIDWKPMLCKKLFAEQGFRNPSTTFDKKFSLAAANAVCGSRPRTDHEADAICLAACAQILLA